MTSLSSHSPSSKRKKNLDIQGRHKVSEAVSRRQKLPVKHWVSPRRTFDGLQSESPSLFTSFKKYSLRESLLRLWRKYEIFSRRLHRLAALLVPEFSPRKLFYGSLSGGVALGMVGMGFVGQLSGPDVSARSSEADETVVQAILEEAPPYNLERDIFFEYFNEETKEAYQENIRKMVAGHPIEEMLPYIFEKDHLVAAFLIGIAKKESNWGKRVPVLEGQDCFNYWGYRGIRKMMGTGGHTCFNSRKDAVDTVAKRLETLIHSQKLDTPEKLIIWKCGYSCEGHSRESVKKWIADVDMYFREASYE